MLSRSFYYPLNKTDLNREAVLNQYRNSERHHQLINSSDLPATWPALNDLFIDDKNRLWIATIVEDFNIYEWWIVEENGVLITRFEWSRNEPIRIVKNGYMYALEIEEDTGLQQIVRYRIEIAES